VPGLTSSQDADAPPATRTGTLTEKLSSWAAGLRFEDLPERIVQYAISQLISQLAVIRAGATHPLGQRLIRAYGPLQQPDPAQVAYLLAGLSSCLYYEDSMYVGHVGHATVNVPLAYQHQLGVSGRDLLVTIVAANECAARVTAAAALGPMRGQTSSYTQLVGAVAARQRLVGAPVRQWVDAFGLALAAPPWSVRRAFVGSDAKVLSAAVPVRIGLDACAGAAAGITGAADILEHPDGFLARFADVPSAAVVVAGLGTRWHTETLSFKMYPAGAYVDAAIECAVQLHPALRAAIEAGRTIEQIEVAVPRLTMTMDKEGRPYLDGDRSSIMALNLSVGYNVATALLTGGVGPADLTAPATGDPERWRLAGKIRLRFDVDLSRRLLAATAPLGEALREARDQAAGWFDGLSGGQVSTELLPTGPPSASFEQASKAVGARLVIRLSDGRDLCAERGQAPGSAGAETRAGHAGLARQKLLRSGIAPAVADALRRTADLDPVELAGLLDLVLAVEAGDPW
jgi:2-methylcitrate dehydratase PrpD